MDRVLLNASRSEAEELLREPPPPRPLRAASGSLQDSAVEPFGRDDLFGPSDDDASPKATYLREEVHLRQARKAEGSRLWAPPSRGTAGGTSSGFRPGSEAGSAGMGSLPDYGRPSHNGPSLPSRLESGGPEPLTPAGLAPAVSPPGTAVVEGRARTQGESRAEVREQDVRAASVGLPRIKPHWTHKYMKVLLVGEDGLGKTTFVRNLFAAYARDASFPINDGSVPNAARVFQDNPEALCTEVVLQDAEAKIYYHYLVQDTPGYADSTALADDRAAVLDYIQDCAAAYLAQEQDPERRAAMHAIRDTRVDAALYFLPPHRLRQIDLRFMADLAGLVPVVPVLAKADTMTGEELKEFRHTVRKALDRAGVHSPFSRDALEDAGARHGPPFAVICSQTMDLEVGRFWPVRRYPWGSVEAMLSQHSDLPVLRRLLFETGYCELKEGTEARFHEYRHAHCAPAAGTRGRGKLKGLLRLATLAGGAVLAAWLMGGGSEGDLWAAVRRAETVRRTKEKVVDPLVDSVRDVQGRAAEAAAVAKTTTGVAVDQARAAAGRAAGRASRALESEEQRKRQLQRVRRWVELVDRYDIFTPPAHLLLAAAATPQSRSREAEEQREAYRRKPWWQFWAE